MARRNAGIRFASIAVAVTLLLTGCIPGFGAESEPGASRLYTGPIPAPAELPTAAEVPAVPTPPADLSDSAAMDAYIKEVEAYSQVANQADLTAHYDAFRAFADTTKNGGEESVAVWQSLLVTAGIAVAGTDGAPIEVDGKTGFGWAMTDAELRLHALLASTPGGLRLVDLADALAAGPDIPSQPLAEAIRDDLSNAWDTGFSKVLSSVQTGTLYANELDQIVLSWATVGLVLRRLSAELAVLDDGATLPDDGAASTGGGPAIALTSFPGAAKTSAGGRACEIKIDNPWAAELVNQFNKAHATFVFDMAVEYIDAATETKARGNMGGKIGLARLAAALYTLYAKAAALKATFSVNNAPLVRTKNTQPGEVRDLTVKYAFEKDSWEEIRGCLNLFLAPFGLDVPGSQAGVAEKIDIQLHSEDPSVLRIGDGKGGNVDVTRGTTDAGGSSTFRISGAPQADILPEVAEPEEVEVAVRAVSNLGGNDFFKDLASLPWDAMDAASTGGLSALPQVLSRMKLLTHTGMIPVRDWSLEADFEATLVASVESRHATNYQTPSGCGNSGRHLTRSTQLTSSIASDAVPVSAILLSNPYGNLGDQAAVFVPTGQEFNTMDFGDGPVMFQLPGNYTSNKTYSEPATGELPPLLVMESNGVCADGGSGGYVPPVPDCGKRNFTDTLMLSVPAPRSLHVASTVGYPAQDLWNVCGHGLNPLAPRLGDCDSPQRKGGKFPAIRDVFDSAKPVIEVNGSHTCREVVDGWMTETDYQWTLVLCRIVEGKSAC